MTSNSPRWYVRWAVFGVGVAVSFLPALELTVLFEKQPDRQFSTLLAFWVELLVGPVKYWVPVLLGQPPFHGLHPMPGLLTWVYAVCLALALVHPLKPNFQTGCVSALAFFTWYVLAFWTLAAFEY